LRRSQIHTQHEKKKQDVTSKKTNKTYNDIPLQYYCTIENVIAKNYTGAKGVKKST